MRYKFSVPLLILFFIGACSEDEKKTTPNLLQLSSVEVGASALDLNDFTENTDLPVDQPILINFSSAIDVRTGAAVMLTDESGPISFDLQYQNDNKTLAITPDEALPNNKTIALGISDELAGAGGETFSGIEIQFTTVQGTFTVAAVIIDGQNAITTNWVKDVDRNPEIEITFPVAINPATVNNTTVKILGGSVTPTLSFSFSDGDTKVVITPTTTLTHLWRYTLTLTTGIDAVDGEIFTPYSKYFYTVLDPTPKMPLLPNDEDNDNDNTNDLLSVVQKQTSKYFYDFAHPASGMARERNTSGNTVTSGGSGFGIMALIVGMERSFITRQQGLDRMDRILDFLETTDEFHGAWAHWMDGNTGIVIPFSSNDNGGDLVETSFLVQGLLTFRQYLDPLDAEENILINRINVLWERVEWDWYRKCDPTCKDVLYWHWSPDKDWIMNFPLSGYFEQQITYFLAAASPTHSISKVVYTNGFTQNGGFVRNDTYTYNGNTYPLKVGGLFPLFWVQYSYLGLNPHFSDDYVDYWQQGVNASLINHDYCVQNPKQFAGYSDECWGLTASDNQSGYNAHSPSNDLGVITPTAALSSFPYTPDESMKALKFFYYKMGDRLWGDYGFYDAFNATENWYASSYLAIDQGPIIVMIENYRTGLLWKLFMSAPEVQNAMTELDFQN